LFCAVQYNPRTDREALESKWKANEAELNRLHAMSPLGRESFAGRIEQLKDENDTIEFELGKEHASGRRWSGMP
jgi:hypothetical protein